MPTASASDAQVVAVGKFGWGDRATDKVMPFLVGPAGRYRSLMLPGLAPLVLALPSGGVKWESELRRGYMMTGQIKTPKYWFVEVG